MFLRSGNVPEVDVCLHLILCVSLLFFLFHLSFNNSVLSNSQLLCFVNAFSYPIPVFVVNILLPLTLDQTRLTKMVAALHYLKILNK